MSHRIRSRIVVTAVILIASPSVAWAGAWTLPRHHWYAEYFYRYFGSKHQFDNTGNSGRRPKTAVFGDIRNEFKLEYGLTDWWNVQASVPYISSHYRDDNTDLLRTGAGDVYVRTKVRALNKPLLADEEPLVGSVQFSWKIPTYNPKRNPLGDGQFDFESRLQLSQSWVYAPYEVRIRRQGAHDSTKAASSVSNAPGAASRETAIQDAVLLAELYQRGIRFAREGQLDQAAKCFRAVLAAPDADPASVHELLAHALGDQAAHAVFMTADAERFEPLPSNEEEYETERRWAKVIFVNLEGGFTARNEDPANEFPIYLEAGFTPFKRLMLISSLDAVVSERSTHEQAEDFWKWGVRAIVNMWGDGFASVFRKTGGPTVNLEVGYNDIFAGRNTADAFEVFGKVGMTF